ncbi:tetratricopeptide repeat protein [Methylibium petroleiphilum]
MSSDIDRIKHQLHRLREMHAAGDLGDAAYLAARAPIERLLIDAVLAEEPVAAAVAPGPAPAGAPVSPSTPSPRQGGRRVAALALGVVVLAGLGYAWQGSPRFLLSPSDASSADAPSPATGTAHATGVEQITAMTEKLALRLKEQPADADGWATLARSYAMLGRNADAVAAYGQAVGLQGNDARLLADYADALAIRNGRKLDGEPLALVRRSLQIDPDNVKALSLAGTEAFDRKDYSEALEHWERLARVGPADSEMVQQIHGSIAEARELAGLPSSRGSPSPSSSSSTGPVAATARASDTAATGTAISGTVTLAASLAGQVSPTDTVFVFARDPQGPAMPLAILRKQVKDLPLAFRLDDSLSMSPAARLSSSARVLVAARISRSGEALPQPGDLLAQPVAATPGAIGIRLEIAGIVPAK